MRNFTKKRALLFFVSCLTINLCSEISYAVDYFLMPETPFTVDSVTSSDAFYFTAVPGRSYCLEMKTMTGTPLAAIQALTATDANLDITNQDRGDATPPIYSPGVTNFSRQSRKCFIVAGDITKITSNRVKANITFTTGTTAGQTEVRLNDSTLIGGFNTSVTDFNFLELTNSLSPTNRDNGVISGAIIIKNVITDAIVSSKEFTVNPSDRVDINIHEAVGPSVFGIISVIHNGPSGSLKGYVSLYNLVSAVPFDFEPVVKQPLLRPIGMP